MPRSKSSSRISAKSSRRHSRQSSTPKKQKRQATVYDAVAGRVSSAGFIPLHPCVSNRRDTPSSSTVPNPPEEVLFRRAGAPTRYEETDIYWADKHLTDKQKLPESDLLKAVHGYASDFYGRATENKGIVDFESLDETALLSVGMLLEEMVEEALGETGDLAFVEGEGQDGEREEFAVSDPHGTSGNIRGDKREKNTRTEFETAASGSATESSVKRRHKRRKVRHEQD